MIEDVTKKLIIKRLLIYVIAAGFLFFIDTLLKDYSIYSDIFHILFILVLIVDLVLHIVMIIKNFGILKLFIVSENILVKIILVIIYFMVRYDRLFADAALSQIYFIIILVGLLTYPIFIMIFMVNSYKDIKISMNIPVLVVLLNGVSLFVLQFFTQTKYDGVEGYEYFLYFKFNYAMFVIYLPFVIFAFLYVIDLFIENKEKI